MPTSTRLMLASVIPTRTIRPAVKWTDFAEWKGCHMVFESFQHLPNAFQSLFIVLGSCLRSLMRLWRLLKLDMRRFSLKQNAKYSLPSFETSYMRKFAWNEFAYMELVPLMVRYHRVIERLLRFSRRVIAYVMWQREKISPSEFRMRRYSENQRKKQRTPLPILSSWPVRRKSETKMG